MGNWITHINIDELLYHFHILVKTFLWDPIWYIISFRWIWDSAAARAFRGGDGFTSGDGFFGDGLFRIFNSRPSLRRDSVEELLNPTEDRSNWEYFTDILFGRTDHESILSVLFGSLFGWILIFAILSFLAWWFVNNKLKFLSEKEKIIYDLAYSQEEKRVANDKATRWQKILDQVNSEEENNWKIAVMDADILLDEVLTEQGYIGTGVGERLKDAERAGFTTLQHAWEGHKVRNKIAHDPTFVITQKDARMAISMFERFFNEIYHMA